MEDEIWLITHVNEHGNALIIEAEIDKEHKEEKGILQFVGFEDLEVLNVYEDEYQNRYQTPLLEKMDDLCGGIGQEYIHDIFKYKDYYVVSCLEYTVVEEEIQIQKTKGFLYAHPDETNPDEVHIHIVCAQKGYGQYLMTLFLKYIYEQTTYKTVSLDALIKVVGFYLKNGFTFRNTCQDSELNITPHRNAITMFYNDNYITRNLTKEYNFLYDLYKQGTLLLKNDCQNNNGTNLKNLSYDQFVKKNCYESTIRMLYCFQKGGALPAFKNFPSNPVAIPNAAKIKVKRKSTRRRKHRSTRTRKLRRV